MFPFISIHLPSFLAPFPFISLSFPLSFPLDFLSFPLPVPCMSLHVPLFPPLLSLRFLAFPLRSPVFFSKNRGLPTCLQTCCQRHRVFPGFSAKGSRKPKPAKSRQRDSSLGPLFCDTGSPETTFGGTHPTSLDVTPQNFASLHENCVRASLGNPTEPRTDTGPPSFPVMSLSVCLSCPLAFLSCRLPVPCMSLHVPLEVHFPQLQLENRKFVVQVYI